MSLICGVDEAGRGSLCGPVFASAVILDERIRIKNLDDSKKISPKIRKDLY
nr:ribonuclease HII [Betaproteobacteria bacterium]